MGSIWMLHFSLLGASSWLILWALFSLLIPALTGALGLVGSVEKGVMNEKETERKSGLEIDGVRGVVSSLPLCVKLAHSEPLALHSKGDIVIGGVFPLHYVASQPQHNYQSKPQLSSCTG